MTRSEDGSADSPRGQSGPEPNPLLTAGHVLAERGVYGLVWFDQDLVVAARYGRLADFIEVGEPLLDACLPLIGLDGDIRARHNSPGQVIDLPAVMIAATSTPLPRLNLTVFWLDDSSSYLMLLARATTRSNLEVELSKQMRARLMAEAELARKSRDLARANAELERINQDLEDFAAIISHDLKSPLRALRYTAEEMAGLIDAGQVDAARAHLDEIDQRTRRMSDMMTALLDYASVSRKAEIAERVATRAIAEDVVASLAIPDGFSVEIQGSWPQITTVAAALDLVLRNLVQNAIVHHDRQQGHVTIHAIDGRNTLTITVTDDGPGIPPDHHAAILMPFRTLSTRTSTTGMGLAFVNRTVTTIGARLEISSDPGRARGSAFKLSWPKIIKT